MVSWIAASVEEQVEAEDTRHFRTWQRPLPLGKRQSPGQYLYASYLVWLTVQQGLV